MKKAGYNIKQICQSLDIAPSSFYYRIKPKEINANKLRLEAAMKHVHHEMDATYGKRRMMAELKDLGFDIGIEKVRSCMKKLGLIAKRPKPHKYSNGQKASVIAPNILNRQFNPEKLNTYWSGDITYIRTQQGWLYLAVVVDLCSRRVISWAFSDKPNSELTIRALRLAVQKRNIKGEVVFHCDQGCQYTSESFQQALKSNGITSSMSRAGNCLDNAVTERFFRSLKSERVNYRRYETRQEAKIDIINYIEPFYNQKRRHYKLGNISPAQYETNLLKCA
ncbi:IS3 family transposase [Catenovulum maritimum]|uniref:Transposase n=1 Tax=Catenovulum maritimum TaxID=1513271 RepID=A0A0J8JN48_9ALTE|nr:IS3 family transposase [Catenovulum maritimum]KMT66021.1 transposase [Catenovulum maritimum]